MDLTGKWAMGNGQNGQNRQREALPRCVRKRFVGKWIVCKAGKSYGEAYTCSPLCNCHV
jgi:hypothetical protein